MEDGSIDSRAKIKGSPCYHIAHSQSKEYSRPNLPGAFARSWKCHPYLTFSEDSLGLNKNTCRKEEKMKYFTSRVDWILKNHSGIGVKNLKILIGATYKQGCSYLDHLDSWLQLAVKPGIEELIVSLSSLNAKYNFPCELLSGAAADSLRYLYLASCNLHSRVKIGRLRSLTRLQLCMVHITEDRLCCLLSNSLTLERLELRYCSMVKRLRIPCLRRLSYLEVITCTKLQVIESKAPNLCSFRFAGGLHVQLALGRTLQIKKLKVLSNDAAFHVLTKLPPSMPNLESLIIHSNSEISNAPIVPSTFCNLKFLGIALGELNYDFLSLVSFFDAAPSLETFILNVLPGLMERPSIFSDPSSLRMMTEHRHDKLKRVEMINFSSAKSLVELTCHIVESTTSLELLKLDTTDGLPRCSDSSANKSGKCFLSRTEALMEARQALLAVQTYINSKAPPRQWS